MRVNLPHIPLASILVLLSLAACKKHDDGSANAGAPVIYVLGTSNDSLFYWKNGQPTLLPGVTGYQAYGDGIAVSGGTVYVCGGSSTLQFAGYGNLWINGIGSPLADTAGNATNTTPDVIF